MDVKFKRRSFFSKLFRCGGLIKQTWKFSIGAPLFDRVWFIYKTLIIVFSK
jgi:hypothetical protein